MVEQEVKQIKLGEKFKVLPSEITSSIEVPFELDCRKEIVQGKIFIDDMSHGTRTGEKMTSLITPFGPSPGLITANMLEAATWPKHILCLEIGPFEVLGDEDSRKLLCEFKIKPWQTWKDFNRLFSVYDTRIWYKDRKLKCKRWTFDKSAAANGVFESSGLVAFPDTSYITKGTFVIHKVRRAR